MASVILASPVDRQIKNATVILGRKGSVLEVFVNVLLDAVGVPHDAVL